MENEIEVIQPSFAEVADLMQQEEQVVVKVNETLENNSYTREIFIPKGTLIIGYKHKKSCVNILTKGALLIKTSPEDEGTEVYVPENQSFVFHTDPESQKMLYAIEDTIMIGVFCNIEGETVEEVMLECVYPDSVTEMTKSYEQHVQNVQKLVNQGR